MNDTPDLLSEEEWNRLKNELEVVHAIFFILTVALTMFLALSFFIRQGVAYLFLGIFAAISVIFLVYVRFFRFKLVIFNGVLSLNSYEEYRSSLKQQIGEKDSARERPCDG